MKNKNKDDYKIPFRGATLSTTEGQKVCIAFLFAAAGAVPSAIIFGVENKPAVVLICLALSIIGLGLANKIIRK
jgi:uncharacterized iron-regulated membrane protein